MTDAGVLELTEIDERLDFDPPCEWGPSPSGWVCDRAAEWIGIFPCCGTPTFRCDEHRKSLEAALDRHAGEGRGSVHIVCKHLLQSRVRWEPLRGGA